MPAAPVHSQQNSEFSFHRDGAFLGNLEGLPRAFTRVDTGWAQQLRKLKDGWTGPVEIRTPLEGSTFPQGRDLAPIQVPCRSPAVVTAQLKGIPNGWE